MVGSPDPHAKVRTHAETHEPSRIGELNVRMGLRGDVGRTALNLRHYKHGPCDDKMRTVLGKVRSAGSGGCTKPAQAQAGWG